MLSAGWHKRLKAPWHRRGRKRKLSLSMTAPQTQASKSYTRLANVCDGKLDRTGGAMLREIGFLSSRAADGFNISMLTIIFCQKRSAVRLRSSINTLKL